MKLKNSLVSAAISAALFVPFSNVMADQYFNDDLVVVGSLCVGMDCQNGENFSFDTVRLKENNLRIRFTDTSASSAFPTRDWEITINDSGNGGQNYFAINNIDSGQRPFVIADEADSDALYIKDYRVGFGTNNPQLNLHVTHGNSPGLRLEQDASSGFSAQTWDVAGNETSFFVRDVTNGGLLPLRIRASAPNGSLYIDNDGDVGLSTLSPDGLFDIASPADANNHAVLVSPVGYFGINIDNGHTPTGLLDVQTTGGQSRFTVANDGDVGIGTSNPTGRFEVMNALGDQSYFNVTADGDVGVGTANPTGRFEVMDSTGIDSYFSIDENGVSSVTSNYIDSDGANCSGGITCGRFSPLVTIEETNPSTTGRMLLKLKNNAPSWIGLEDTTLNTQWFIANAPTSLNFALSDFNAGSLTVPLQLYNNGDVKMAGTLYSNSSVYLKENIDRVSIQRVLDLVSQLNVYTWDYRGKDQKAKHMGPMAQDFYAAFGLGKDNEHISSLDVNGVSLAAIKALYERVIELEKKLKQVESQKRLE